MVRAGLALRQNRASLLFIVLWLVAIYVVFVRSFGLSRSGAALVALCVSKASGGWPSVYQSFTEVVVFGVIASVVVTNVTRKYRPEETCRALAQRSSGHVVVIGWTNLGRRVADLVTAAGRSVSSKARFSAASTAMRSRALILPASRILHIAMSTRFT